MGNSELQALVKAHHRGQLNRHDYRRLRRELVDKLAQGDDMELIDTDPTSPATVPHYTAERRRHPAPPAASRSKAGLLLFLATVAIALGGGWFYYLHFAPEPDNGIVGDGAAAAPWLQDFINAPTWDGPRIAAFSRHWESMAAGQRQALRQTPQFHRLMDMLSHQLTEQRALAELNNDRARQQEMRLRELQRILQR